MIEVEISRSSGFCFGVVNAINHAERELNEHGNLMSLGDIVHNSQEVNRLYDKGLEAIDYERLRELKDARVLFRAHGEAPKIYEFARANNIEIVDATCPVVLALQKRILKTYLNTRIENGQIVIFGKAGHAEVNGLVGQTNEEAIVVQTLDQLKEKVDFTRPIYLFSQTTMNGTDYAELIEYIEQHIQEGVTFKHSDTICKQVSNRVPELIEFARAKDWVYFIAGRNSSNGKVLYHEALSANPHTTFISSAEEITDPLPEWVHTVGVSGATSTPMWLMEEVRDKLLKVNNSK